VVALKVLPAHLASESGLCQRLEREAAAISSLNRLGDGSDVRTRAPRFLGDLRGRLPVNEHNGWDMLAGPQGEIHAQRDRKLEEARKQRQVRRQKAA
jgi:hypothetical protein